MVLGIKNIPVPKDADLKSYLDGYCAAEGFDPTSAVWVEPEKAPPPPKKEPASDKKPASDKGSAFDAVLSKGVKELLEQIEPRCRRQI
jgi:hypothetical protein